MQPYYFYLTLLLLFPAVIYAAVAVAEGGRPCFVPLHDCPDGSTCVVQEGDYGHCG